MSVGTDDIGLTRRDELLMRMATDSTQPLVMDGTHAENALSVEDCDTARTLVSDDRFPRWSLHEVMEYLDVYEPELLFHLEGHCSCERGADQHVYQTQCAAYRIAYRHCESITRIVDEWDVGERTVKRHVTGMCTHDAVLADVCDLDESYNDAYDHHAHADIIEMVCGPTTPVDVFEKLKEVACERPHGPVSDETIDEIDVEESEDDEESEVQQVVDSVVDGDESETDTLFTNDGGVREDE